MSQEVLLIQIKDDTMAYLEEFKKQIDRRDTHKFFQLWEEYCTNDEVDADEFLELITYIKNSDFRKFFGQFVETALPLWRYIQDEDKSYEVIKILMDLETTNTSLLADTAFEVLEKKYADDPKFKKRIRQVGLRARESFQGCISNYQLLAHLKVGNCVFHTAGWGTGEIMDVSDVREQIGIEFENVAGTKHLSFNNAFKTLIPLASESFLARRFAHPDELEAEAKKDPLLVLKLLLKDLGPKTAAEIKDGLCELVIPEAEWTKWWQGARSRLKKDTKIETPSRIHDPFRLRSEEILHEDRLLKAVQHKSDPSTILQTSYTFVRDFPNMLRKGEVKATLLEKLIGLFDHPGLTIDLELQLLIFLDNQFNHRVEGKDIKKTIMQMENIEEIINTIEIIAFKKKALALVRENREDWPEIFLSMLQSVHQTALRDYILSELNSVETKYLLNEKLEELLHTPMLNPELFVWYFQKVSKKGEGDLPFWNKEGQCRFLETFLVLLHKIEHEPKYKDLTKKMLNLLSAKRYALTRNLIEGTSIDFMKEFLLLVSKCHIFTVHDKKIMRSLAQVVHPSLAPKKQSAAVIQADSNIVWTTEEGYLKTQERIKEIATKEMVENAREVEAARALGDLRENAEYKSACERRSRLQGEMKMLSNQLNRARVITTQDIIKDEVSIGSTVELQDPKGNINRYTILGPWEADPDEGVISFQSKFAQAIIGRKIGDSVKFREEEYTVKNLKSFLE